MCFLISILEGTSKGSSLCLRLQNKAISFPLSNQQQQFKDKEYFKIYSIIHSFDKYLIVSNDRAKKMTKI